ncbi:unnamed protein product, partial [Medioppia subpectinata]
SSFFTRIFGGHPTRTLQYRLDTNDLADTDWIVHSDEETVMTEQSVREIVNFVADGRHDFGQGLITYADQQVVNAWTTLMDTRRIAMDLGVYRFQMKYFNCASFGWKGSFMMCRVKAEMDISFDNGLDGSVLGCLDYIEQRTRWFQGVWLVIHVTKIPYLIKLPMVMSFYSYMTKPLHVLLAILVSVNNYMFIFGAYKGFDVTKLGVKRYVMYMFVTLLAIPMSFCADIIIVINVLTTNKYKFYIVDKHL